MGALVAFPIAWLMSDLPIGLRVCIAVAVGVASIAITQVYMRGMDAASDPQEIVLDEFAGCLLALAFVPFEPLWALLAFGLFRVLDIAKPWPVRYVERRFKGAFGVMLDDLVAGVIAGVVLGAAAYLF